MFLRASTLSWIVGLDRSPQFTRQTVVPAVDRFNEHVLSMAAVGVTNAQVNAILTGGIIEGKPVGAIRELREALKVVHGDKVLIKDKNGQDMAFEVGHYAKMVAVTKSRETTVKARHAKLQEKGIDLVVITGKQSNNFCTAYMDKVFSIGGDHPKYPPLESLPWGGPPFHPNCSKTTRPFIEELADPDELERAQPDPGSASLLNQSPAQAQRIYRRSLNADTLDRPKNTPSQRELDGFADLREPRRFEDDQPEVSQAWGKANYRKWAAGLDATQRQVIGEYQAGQAMEINRQLWQIGDPARLSPKVRAQVEALDQALAKARVPQDIVVYRGMPDRQEYYAKHENLVGSILPTGGFSCTSLRKQSAARYTLGGNHPVLMEIVVPKGTRAAYLPSVTKRQLLDDELVISRHHQMKVVAVINQPGKPLLMKLEVVHE